jgi:hypothetical protein
VFILQLSQHNILNIKNPAFGSRRDRQLAARKMYISFKEMLVFLNRGINNLY